MIRACWESPDGCEKATGFSSSSLIADHAFTGLESESKVKESTIACLKKITTDIRSYQDVAGSIEVDLRKSNPLPWLEAVQRPSDVNGYHCETMLLLLQTNLSFLEHEQTTVTHTKAVKSQVSCAQTCCCGLPASSRKSDMAETIDQFIVKANDQLERTLITDATKKGLENLLLNERRSGPEIFLFCPHCPLSHAIHFARGKKGRMVLLRKDIPERTKKQGHIMHKTFSSVDASCKHILFYLCRGKGILSTSELANTIFCEGVSDQNAGLHFVPKQRLCQYTQSEKISTATGAGLHLAFIGKLVGQYERFISTMQPCSIGWYKRPTIAVVPPFWLPDPRNEALTTQLSEKLIEDPSVKPFVLCAWE